ncbi:MAG: SH3 domain-containing protein [Bryobacteraceae bacterium]
MRKPLLVASLAITLSLAACRSSDSRVPAIGEAYAGPASLPLRKDIPLQSPVVATAKHGDKIEIVQRRRKFLKVRLSNGTEGWTDERGLLSAEEMTSLQEVERRARTLPSQGVASTYDLLNVHTEPNRFSPSFLQIKEHEKVDVVGHMVTPRLPPDRKPLIKPRPKQAKIRKPPEPKYPLPPPPAAPPLPANWLELSKTPAEIQRAIADDKSDHPVPTDDWSLVRNAQGQSGWVLTRRLFMAIPDEVAQYAEGHRISSYFSLADTPDGDQMKHVWLWTTIAGGEHSYDFDSFRVFIWSVRRHRYETAFIQRNVRGHFPVLQRPVSLSSGSRDRGSATATTYPGFSVCLENESGSRVRRNYAFIVNVVRFAGEEACEVSGNVVLLADGTAAPAMRKDARPAPQLSFYSRFKTSLGALAKKWLKH